MINSRKNVKENNENSLQKLQKAKLFLLKPGVCEYCSGARGTSCHGSGVIWCEDPPCICAHILFLALPPVIDRFRSRTRTWKTTWKWRVVPMYGYATPFWRHFHVVFHVVVLNLNLSNIIIAQCSAPMILRSIRQWPRKSLSIYKLLAIHCDAQRSICYIYLRKTTRIFQVENTVAAWAASCLYYKKLTYCTFVLFVHL
jgi:hypothetical protein